MKVALYPRVSGHEQEDNYSIPEQIERMKKYCEAKDWLVYKIYTDTVQTGADMNRPGLQSLIKDCEDGKFDMVLVYKLDRLSRSQKDTMYLIEDVFEKNNVGFTSMTENFDTSTPHGKFIIGILAVFAQLERDKIAERTTMGKKARAAEGKWHGSKWVPIGYDYVDGLLQVNEYEKMQILEIADLFLKGTPVRTIATMMTEKGYKHKHGIWEAKTIKRVLSNPVNLGLIKDGDQLYPGLHDAILEEETFDAIQVIMNQRKAENGTNYKPHKSLLAGFLFCKHCGGRYARQTNGKGRKCYYSCYSRNKSQPRMVKDPNCKNKNYRAEELDAAILGEIRKLAIDPEYVAHVRENKPKNDVNEKIKSISSEIEKINSQISNLMDFYALDGMDMEMIATKIANHNKTKAALQKELESLDVPEEDDMTVEEIQSLAAMMKDDLDLQDKRNIIQSLLYYIEIDNEKIMPHWKF